MKKYIINKGATFFSCLPLSSIITKVIRYPSGIEADPRSNDLYRIQAERATVIERERPFMKVFLVARVLFRYLKVKLIYYYFNNNNNKNYNNNNNNNYNKYNNDNRNRWAGYMREVQNVWGNG